MGGPWGSSWGRNGEGEAKAKAKARPRRGEGEGQAKARRRQGEGQAKGGGGLDSRDVTLGGKGETGLAGLVVLPGRLLGPADGNAILLKHYNTIIR